MAIYVVSDLHLMDRSEPFLFNLQKEKRFCELCDVILATKGHLVLAGDIFDFTGMTPPKVGLQNFFAEVLSPDQFNAAMVAHVCKLRTTADLLQSIKKIFPDFFSSLKALADLRQLTYIPGNHDCDFLSLESRLVFAEVLEVDAEKIIWTNQFEYPGHLLIVHGNEFDPQNQTNGVCQNQGFIFTSALYHGVLPALKMLSVDPQVIAAIPAVRPEEAVISGLKHFLDDETLKKILLALTRLLARNGYFTGFGWIIGFLLTRQIPLLSQVVKNGITVERVRGVLPKDELLIANARNGATFLREKNPKYKNATIIMGHTHELDVTDHYANLGTWIDHLTGLEPKDLEKPDVSLPVLKVEATDEAVLFNVGHSGGVELFHQSSIIAIIKKNKDI